MSTLAENVANWLGRVELLARGVDERRREALRSLERGDPVSAREHALALLEEVPSSPVGLAILVDACEAMWLNEEAVEALQKLCDSAPWRAELWVRLADGMIRLEAPSEDVARVLENALEPDMEPAARRRALLLLTDLDLEGGDVLRASRWLEALRFHAQDSEVALRRLELAWRVGDQGTLRAAMQALGEPGTLDARATLAVGRARWMMGEPGAFDLILRSFVLEAPGSKEALASLLAKSRDVVEVRRARDVLAAAGRLGDPSFALALALAEGRDEDAREALVCIARAGDTEAARTLYDIALERREWEPLGSAVEVLGDRAPREGRLLLDARAAWQDGLDERVLTILDSISASTPARHLAQSLRVEVFSKWLTDEEGSFGAVLGEIRKAAGALDRLDIVGACEALAVEQQRPLRVAVVGEFNAGKSTFINALLGADVAPTGILPTTASLHWLTWAPDPFARIVTMEGADRIVPHEGLKEALDALRADRRSVREVHICAPIERLRRIEVLDTPGFNAPDADHVTAATRAVHEAHVVLWILDGTQALKDSERRVLARIADVGTPVQVLVNKRDRIDEAKMGEVLSHVAEGLASIGLSTMVGVVGFSARLALVGRMGDEEAKRRSAWDEVEVLLSESIVDRSDELKIRALWRKALGMVETLDAMIQAGKGQEEPVLKEPLALSAQGARLLSLDRTGCERVIRRLEESFLRVREDLRPLRVASMQVDDVNASAYAEARLVARMSEPLAQALVEVAELEKDCESVVKEAAVHVLRGAAAGAADIDHLARLPSWRVVRSCATVAHDLMMARHAASAPSIAENPRWLRLAAVRKALELESGKIGGKLVANP